MNVARIAKSTPPPAPSRHLYGEHPTSQGGGACSPNTRYFLQMRQLWRTIYLSHRRVTLPC